MMLVLLCSLLFVLCSLLFVLCSPSGSRFLVLGSRFDAYATLAAKDSWLTGVYT